MLSLILPTYNEAATITSLLEVLDGVLASVPHEIIVVDDNSPDRTWKVATEFSKLRGCIKVLRRIGKRGLSSAVIDGFDAAHGTILAVMDADGQHDAALLLSLVRSVEQGADIGIGSRYVSGGSVGSWIKGRRIISNAGTFIATLFCRVPVSDPLSGFFALRTDLYRSVRSKLQPRGFKILLEILAHVPQRTKLVEVPLVFRMRLHGESKLSFRVHVAFLLQILRLTLSSFGQVLLKSGMTMFIALCASAFLVLLSQLFHLRLLYADASVRNHVRSSLVTVADREGWLLSDIQLLSVAPDAISIVHIDHLRATSAPRHCTVTLDTFALTCVD